MTFGNIKSSIERNLLESYKDEKIFKRTLREFRHNVLSNKNLSKLYSIYDQLSTPQGLSEIDAKNFLEEGLNLIERILPSVKLPKMITENSENNYKDIDVLAYNLKTNLSERLQSRKNILSILISEKNKIKKTVNLPLKSMVNVANQTLKNYVESLDENSKKELLQIVSEDLQILENKFEELKGTTISKLQSIMESENENDVKHKISETIDKLKVERFDQINYLKLKNFASSI